MMLAPDFPARYVRLIEKLGADMKHAHGWKKSASERLGIDPTLLSRILSGERRVGWDLASRAVERLRLDPNHFTDTKAPDVLTKATITARTTS